MSRRILAQDTSLHKGFDVCCHFNDGRRSAKVKKFRHRLIVISSRVDFQRQKNAPFIPIFNHNVWNRFNEFRAKFLLTAIRLLRKPHWRKAKRGMSTFFKALTHFLPSGEIWAKAIAQFRQRLLNGKKLGNRLFATSGKPKICRRAMFLQP